MRKLGTLLQLDRDADDIHHSEMQMIYITVRCRWYTSQWDADDIHHSEMRIFFARFDSLKCFAALAQLKFGLFRLECFSAQILQLQLQLPGLSLRGGYLNVRTAGGISGRCWLKERRINGLTYLLYFVTVYFYCHRWTDKLIHPTLQCKMCHHIS